MDETKTKMEDNAERYPPSSIFYPLDPKALARIFHAF
jgi:hypothetical protein